MPDTPDDAYSLSLRLAALAGLFMVGILAFILIDIASGGKLTGCDDCGKQEATEDA